MDATASGGEKNSAVELQCNDSVGIRLIAENLILPRIERMMAFTKGPPCRANRSDTSTYSYVRTDGDKSTRSGTQCVEATSVG